MTEQVTKAKVLNHLMRFREMMKGEGSQPRLGINQAISAYENVSKINKSLDSKQFAQDLFAQKSIEISKEVGLKKSIEFISLSSWSPPPLNRQLSGDLIYLYLKTLEKEEWEITCSASGYFVSNSSSQVFNPTVKKEPFATIVELIASISPLFAENWSLNEKTLQSRHILTLMDTFQPAIPWKTSLPTHTMDPARALDDFLLQGLDTSHDWNEDLVLARQLNSDDMVAIVNRDTSVVQTMMEFKRAAVSICLDIVKGAILPINEPQPEVPVENNNAQETDDADKVDANESAVSQEPAANHVESDSKMYIHNHIFLSEGYDAKESFEEYGGAEANHVAAGKDIAGIAGIY
jgi:protein TIF31